MVRTTSPRAVGLRHRWKNTQLPRWNTSPGHKAPGRANLGDDEIFEKTLNPNKVKVAKPMQRKSFNSTLVLLEFMNERRQQGPRNQSPVPLSSPPGPSLAAQTLPCCGCPLVSVDGGFVSGCWWFFGFFSGSPRLMGFWDEPIQPRVKVPLEPSLRIHL